MSQPVYNFSSGPAILPPPVVRATQAAIGDLAGSGIGVMEHSHRGPEFMKVAAEAEATCREIADIPDDYAVLFLQGGASSQFFMVPMNFLSPETCADYLVTGTWSEKAIAEAKRYGEVHAASSSKDKNYSYVPDASAIKYSASPRYVHFTSNNTIFGTQYASEPAIPDGAFLVCDASSDIFSRPIDIKKYGIVYAGAQKNLGPSGLTLVIIRRDLLDASVRDVPTMLSYATHASNDSMFNTPPTLGMFVAGEVFKWIRGEGGLSAMAERNEAKAKLLYDYLDASKTFYATAAPGSRSLMNVCFRAHDEGIEKAFLAAADSAGLSGIKGHRSVGGMRASIYNAFPKAGIEALLRQLDRF